MNVYLEIFGYIGTALVIISMMMTSILKLRIINMCGGVISLIYAILTDTWPVAVLNTCLVCINLFQTIRGVTQKTEYGYAVENSNSGTVKYFLSCHEKDIGKICGERFLILDENAKIYLAFVSSELAGIFSVLDENGSYILDFAYVVPEYREKDIGNFVVSRCNELKNSNIIIKKRTDEYNTFLTEIGF